MGANYQATDVPWLIIALDVLGLHKDGFRKCGGYVSHHRPKYCVSISRLYNLLSQALYIHIHSVLFNVPHLHSVLLVTCARALLLCS
jgi:hypothetical protein